MDVVSTPAHISRRRVIAGIAWSVPVIAGVSATPAFAASTIISKAVVAPSQAPTGVTRNQAGSIFLSYAAVFYEPNNWGVTPNPNTATVSWHVEVVNASNQVVATIVTVSNDTIAKWGTSATGAGNVTGLPPGPYRLRTVVDVVTFIPPTIGDNKFVNINTSVIGTPITVI